MMAILAVDPARVEAADARVLRPTREDMLDRISGQSSAADGKFACLECGERFESLAAVDKHRRATHQIAMRNDANAQRNGVPAICPECELQFGTLQQLQRC
jgi:transcription elongation factor Elf1